MDITLTYPLAVFPNDSTTLAVLNSFTGLNNTSLGGIQHTADVIYGDYVQRISSECLRKHLATYGINVKGLTLNVYEGGLEQDQAAEAALSEYRISLANEPPFEADQDDSGTNFVGDNFVFGRGTRTFYTEPIFNFPNTWAYQRTIWKEFKLTFNTQIWFTRTAQAANTQTKIMLLTLRDCEFFSYN